MTDIRQDFSKTADDVANLAKEVAYVAIGLGVLGFHKAQVRRQELAGAAARANRTGDLQDTLAEARKELSKRVRDFDATLGHVIEVLDTTFQPVWQRLPEPAQTVVQQAREARDQVRSRVVTFAA
jgi:O-acetyl-ADP-ribose deacetylase (regulator of RNase III)